MEKVVAKVLNLLDAANDDGGEVLDVVVVVVLMMQILGCY